MKVKLLIPLAGVPWSGAAGAVVEIPDNEDPAKWIKAGIAVPVPDAAPPDESPASAPAPVQRKAR